MVNFPNLQQSTNDFPQFNINNFDQWQNNYNYDNYTSELVIKLCNVRWFENSEDRPCFETENERNNYFQNITGIELKSRINLTPQTRIKLPVPYNNLMNYNYLQAESPLLPGSGDNLVYSNNDNSRFYYFINEMNWLSPSTTECILSMDFWTTFQHKINIPRIQLYRGHLPQNYTTVTDFLNDPINNTRGLLYSEPEEPNMPINVAKNDYYPLNNSELFGLIAWKTSPARCAAIEEITTVSGWTSLPNINLQTFNSSPGYSMSNILPNGFGVTAVNISSLETMLENINNSYHTLINLIEAVYVIPGDFFERGAEIIIAGVTNYYVNNLGVQSLANISFSETDFDLPENYKHLTKLYTSPYSYISIITENGNEVLIGVEEIAANLNVNVNVQAIYPYLKTQVFLSGIGGNNSTSFQWQTVDGAKNNTISDTGFTRIINDLEIPCYQLMVNAENVWNATNNSAGIYQAEINANNAYNNTVRSAQTALENVQNTNATNVANTQRSNNNSINNTELSNDTLLENTTNNNYTNNLNVTDQNQLINANSLWGNNKLAADIAADQLLQIVTNNVNDDVAAATAISNGVSSVLGGIVGGAFSGGVKGAIAGGVNGVMSAALTGFNTAVAINANDDLMYASIDNSYSKYNNSLDFNNSSTTATIGINNDIMYRNNENILSNTENQITLNSNITENNANTSNSNASASAETSNSNAANTYNTTVTNAGVILAQAEQNVESNVRDLHRQIATIALRNGDASNKMLGFEGVQIRVLTQAADILKRCGDIFLKYGYSTNEIVENPSWNLKNKFTFWQGDAIVYGNAPTNAIIGIKQMFINGVTFWANPDEIGASIYENEV